jgi:organic hydroperoxide reductase OsmC/OhrA
MAMAKTHSYAPVIQWTGNRGEGTRSYDSYARDHTISAAGKPPVPGSSDPAFRGDPTRYNPEDLLVASVSACHMLWYLHLCASAGINVTRYLDRPVGIMTEEAGGSGRFTGVTLKPEVTITAGDEAKAKALHHKAHELCFVANSVNFPIAIEGYVRMGAP